LELGGKNPTIICQDADLSRAVPEACRASFTNQGEICLCGSRILVHASICDAFVERFLAEVAKLRVGDPQDPATDFGAIVSQAHLEKVLSYIELARSEGGAIRCGGGRPEGLPERCRDGYFVAPTVVTGLGPECRVQQEEIFGPVVTIWPYESDEELVALANGTPYGLAASVWTTNLGRAHALAARLDAGTIWINCWLLRDLRVPFGGMKASGVGREGGREALRFFTEPKNVCIRMEKLDA
ncbi:MAG: aldehyde dehydrogenase family protein, partial [Phycisphaerales bacterium]|nr:aldehyde dehydrogenase family protein [Phycisphaerales bacterium]